MSTTTIKSKRRANAVAPSRSPSAQARIRRILVPLDFSGHSREALRYAVPLAEKFGATIILLHVVPPRLTSPDLALIEIDKAPVKREAARQLDEIGHSIAPAALYERSVVSVGHAAQEILMVADRVAADVIVLSTHGHSGVKRFLMGSTAEQVLRHADCPVFVVRRK